MPGKVRKQQRYLDADGKRIKCPRCGGQHLTTRNSGCNSKLKDVLYCKDCSRSFALGVPLVGTRSVATPKELLEPYVRLTSGTLLWSIRYRSWFFRPSVTAPWQTLDDRAFLAEIKTYLRHKKNFTSLSKTVREGKHFMKRCLDYLKHRLGDETFDPDPFHYSLGNPPCPHCGATHTTGRGSRKGKHYFRCKNCDRGFVANLGGK